jgi:putative aldouronate transport system substrate-binding protein
MGKIMRKLLVILLCAVTIATMTVSTVSTALAEENPIEISIALWEIDPSFVEKDDAVYKYVCDKLGITIKPIPMTWDDYTEKINTWVATDDMPDVFSIDIIGTETLMKWVRDEMIKPMPEDLTPYPNLAKLFTLPDILVTAIDGVFWNVPRAKADMSIYDALAKWGCYYRKDWAEKLGLNEPTTVDEFIEFIRAMVNGDPTGTGSDIVGLTSS